MNKLQKVEKTLEKLQQQRQELQDKFLSDKKLDYAALNREFKEVESQISEQEKLWEEIAEQLEVSTQMISNLECGRKAVRLQNLVRLATVLDTSIGFLLTGKRFSEERNDLSRKVVRLSDDDAELINVIVNYCLSRHTTNVPSSSHEHF